MNFNKAGLDLLKHFEGCELRSYQDVVGIWTIGYGAIGGEIGPGLVWTQAQADERLSKDLIRFQIGVENLIKYTCSDSQFSALVCLAYNIGLSALKSSTLLRKFNGGDIAGAALEFVKWDRAGGKEIPGLLARRKAEQKLFLS